MATEDNTSQANKPIRSVQGEEPQRPNEYPWTATVGYHLHDYSQGKVVRIEERQENMGTYGINWYDVWCQPEPANPGDPMPEEIRVASFNALYVAVVTY